MNDAWRAEFQTMPRPEQHRVIHELARQGLKPGDISAITGWHRRLIELVLRLREGAA